MIDLRNDTLTKPATEMYRAMYDAELGDEQNMEDPWVKRLPEIATGMLGKEVT